MGTLFAMVQGSWFNLLPFLLLGTVEFTSADYFDVYVTDIDNPISFYLHRIGEDYSVRQSASCHFALITDPSPLLCPSPLPLQAKLQSMTEAMSNRLSQSSTKPGKAVQRNLPLAPLKLTQPCCTYGSFWEGCLYPYLVRHASTVLSSNACM